MLPGWAAVNVNRTRRNTPGHDVLAAKADGRELLVSVTSRSRGRDYAIGSSFKKYPADVYTFVDMTDGIPGERCISRAVQQWSKLAKARNSQYQPARGRPDDVLGSWSPKVSEGILEAMGTHEAWVLLDHPAPAAWPPFTAQFLGPRHGATLRSHVGHSQNPHRLSPAGSTLFPEDRRAEHAVADRCSYALSSADLTGFLLWLRVMRTL